MDCLLRHESKSKNGWPVSNPEHWEDDFAGVAFPWRTDYIYEFDHVRLEGATTKKQGSVRSSKSQR